MQKLRWLVVLGSLGLVTPLICADSLEFSILTEEDYTLESVTRDVGPSLSSPLDAKDQWESYNEWRCFPKEVVELTCNEIDTDEGDWRKNPILIATTDKHTFEYDLDPTTPWDCDFTLNEWRHVIDGTGEVCLFAAYLQPLDEGVSLWVLDRIKTERGYWKEYESASYARAQQEPEE